MQRFIPGVLLSLSLVALAPELAAAPALQDPAGEREALQPPPLAAQPTAPGAWARYLPPRTIALVSARSTQAVLDVGEQFAAALDQPFPFDASMLWAMALPFDCDASLIDPAREVHLALVLEPGAFEPAPVLFLPSADPARLAASLAPESGFRAAAHEGYAIVSNLPLPAEPSAAPHALAAQLLQGQVAVQLDLETLIATFRPLIDMGLMQAEAQMDSAIEGAQASGGMQGLQGMEGMDVWMQEGLDFVRELLDVSQGLGFALRLEKSELEIDGRYTMESGSSFAGMHGSRVRALSAHRDLLDPQASVISLSNIDYELYAAPLLALSRRWFDPLMQPAAQAEVDPNADPAASAEADELRQLDEMFTLARAAMPMYGTLQACSFDFDAQRGLGFEMHTRGADPAKLAEAQRQWLAWMQTSALGVGFAEGGLSEREVAGRKLLQGRMNFDMSKFAAAHALGEPERAEAETFSTLMQSMLYPETARFSIASRADEMLVVQGDDARLGRALARGATPARFEPAFERALARCGSVSPAVATQIDLARATNWIGDFVKAISALEDAPKDMPFDALPSFSHPFWLTSWAALGATDFSGGVHFDLDELGHFVDAWVSWTESMRAAEPEPEPFTYEIK
jgi:hypothetical protein